MINTADYKIVTFGSHSALQILKGAKDEGFRTVCLVKKDYLETYRSFQVADELIPLEQYHDFFDYEERLKKENGILIPHGSFVASLGSENMEKITMPYFGNREIIKWESDRKLESQWLQSAGLLMPKVFASPRDINCPVIVKFHGAGGGQGYFLANSEEDFQKKYQAQNNHDDYLIQEYIVGATVYAHYFYSELNQELEIMSFDKRYESNVDSLGRIVAKDQLNIDLEASYSIVGNIPIVLRESLLAQYFEMGKQVVSEAKRIEPRGFYGPFCLETVIDPNLQIYTFEISARIVAGTNPFVHGSPYSWLRYNEPMSTGRRIAREIKQALQADRLTELI